MVYILKPQFHGISNCMVKSGDMAYDDLFVYLPSVK